MLKSKLKALLLIVFALIIIASYSLATTESEQLLTSTENTTEITADATNTGSEEQGQKMTSDDLYIIDSSVNIDSIIDGNAYIMGANVTISSEIGGDVFIIADKVNITKSGYIYSNLFVIANEINIDGIVYDIYSISTKLNIGENAYIYRDVRSTASEINISGHIRRNVFLSSGNINFAENAKELVGGNFNYFSDKKISIPEEAVIGETVFTEQVLESNNTNTVLSKFVSLLKTLFFTLVVAIILIWLAPKFVENVGNVNGNKIFSALGIGFLAPIVLTILGIILVFSVIGIPIFATLLFAFIMLAILANSVTYIFFGKLLTKKFNMQGNIRLIIVTLLSCAVLWIIGLVPVLGTIISLIVPVLGLGLILINIPWKRTNKTAKTKKAEEK